MSSTTNRWKLGLFVVVGVSAFLVLFLWVGAERLQREAVVAHAYFDEDIGGLEVGAPVKFRGVAIGKVKSIRTASDQRTVEVVSNVYIDALESLGLSPPSERAKEGRSFAPSDLRVQLVSSILTGQTFVQSDFFDVETHPIPDYPFEVPWNTVHSTPSTAKNLEDGLIAIVDRLPPLLDEVTGLAQELRGALAKLPVGELSRRVEDALVEVQGFVGELGAEDANWRTLIDRYEAIGADLQAVIGEADLVGTAAALRTVSADVSSATKTFELLSHDVHADLSTLWEALASLKRLTDLLERDPAVLLRGKSSTSAR